MAEHETPEEREMLRLAGGVALMVFGAGLILASPSVRRLVLQGLGAGGSSEGLPSGLAGMLPDMERYLKIRSM